MSTEVRGLRILSNISVKSNTFLKLYKKICFARIPKLDLDLTALKCTGLSNQKSRESSYHTYYFEPFRYFSHISTV